MEVPGNAWQEAWENAKPVPARRQRRLFDDTREAEKVLQFLSGLRPGETMQLLMPNLLHAAAHRTLKEPLGVVPHAKDLVRDAIALIAQMSRLPCRPEVKHYSHAHNADYEKRNAIVTDLVKRLAHCETVVSQAMSLRAKFLKDATAVTEQAEPDDVEAVASQMETFVQNLYMLPEVGVVGAGRGPAGQLIQAMFREAQKAAHMFTSDEGLTSQQIFPPPDSREYILRTSATRPLAHSRETPQRMYCCIKKSGVFRLAGAFSVDKLHL